MGVSPVPMSGGLPDGLFAGQTRDCEQRGHLAWERPTKMVWGCQSKAGAGPSPPIERGACLRIGGGGFPGTLPRVTVVHSPPCGALSNRVDSTVVGPFHPPSANPGSTRRKASTKVTVRVELGGRVPVSRQPDELTLRLLPGIFEGWCSQAGLRLLLGSRTQFSLLQSLRTGGRQAPAGNPLWEQTPPNRRGIVNRSATGGRPAHGDRVLAS
jgi:hypothetical protein